MRPFRFLATAGGYPGFAELTSLARKAEAIGCSTFVLPDHLIGQYGAMPLLAVVAAASERLRVGTFVLNVCLRHPAVLAQDLATLGRAARSRGARRPGRNGSSSTGSGGGSGPARRGGTCCRPTAVADGLGLFRRWQRNGP